MVIIGDSSRALEQSEDISFDPVLQVGLEMVLNSAGSVASIQCLQGRQFPMAIFMSIVPDADANTHINTDAGVIPRAWLQHGAK